MRWLTWALGEVDARASAPLPATLTEQRALLALVLVVGCTAMWLGEFYRVGVHPLVTGPWRLAIHGGLPLAGVALWAHRDQPRGWWLSLAGIGLVLGLLYARLGGPPVVRLWLAHRLWLQGAVLLGMGLLLAGLRRGGWDAAAWGAGRGDWRWWLPRTALAAALLVAGVAVVVSLSPGLQRYYPRWRPARHELAALWTLNAGVAIDFLGWEFLFRGFLLSGLARFGRPWLAIVAQAIPFFLLHWEKPALEFWISLPGGILAGWFCYRARCFWPLFLLHVVQMWATNLVSYSLRHGGGGWGGA